ncbi:MAG: beta-galactosidase, partial [Armatimonadetes bacterium]|nr:beta-galactosidase [Armatimonadota bacterium]
MTAPSMPNWYYQAFFNWTFDDEELRTRPAEMHVVRPYGTDAMIEYLWDTPVVRAWVRFAMVEGSDKLLMFGGYEPKREVKTSRLEFVCYPAFFPEPRQRAVTTALGTRRPGDSIQLDLEKEHWVLYEDTTEGRPGDGSAGMIIGTPDAFAAVTIPVGAYGINTTLELKPDARRWALALYDFPSLPDYRETREYFARLGDAEAEALERIAAGDLDQPLGEMPRDEKRVAAVLALGAEMFDRPSEIWRPSPEPLEFPWAHALPGAPIRTVLFCHRWRAWESMELARRLELDVDHLYFDSREELSNSRAWPYASTTGIGPIPYGVASVRANAMASRDDTELYMLAGLYSKAVPGVTRIKIMEQVSAGKGLLLSGAGRVLSDWPKEFFADPDPDLAARILSGLDWRSIPGLGDGEPGRVGDAPVRAWRYGRGRVVMLAVNLSHFSCFTPRNSVTEGIMGAMDRTLALAARAAMFAAGREPRCEIALSPGAGDAVAVSLEPAPPAGAQLRWRIQDDLERIIAAGELKQPGAAASIAPPPLPPGRRCWLDAAVYDARGETLGFSFIGLPAARGARVANLTVEPSTLTHELSVPWVKLPDGGDLKCSASVAGTPPDGASLHWQVSDVFGRVLAEADTPATARAQVTLSVGRPVTVCHMLDVTLRVGERTLDYARLRFTNPPPYPYDDFTGLMWTTASESPILLLTDRLCYEWGADMGDPANTVGADDERCARTFALRARSGLRIVPYATRVFGQADTDNVRKPCLHDPGYIASQIEYLSANARQAAPYAPAAYTLGDENALDRKGRGEPCYGPHTLTAFRDWLQGRYGNIAALNTAWGSDWKSFEEVVPPLIGEAAKLPGNWAAWFDHKTFMDESFTGTHDWMRETIREQDPGARVGWDGLLGYHWQAGYDFDRLTRNCDLNQVYVSQWIPGELVRSFARPDALIGKWGNRVANNEAGWTAYPWHCLFDGCNSAWWWTSWGCDYVPFNPDISQSKFGEWFFKALDEVRSGPGKLILHAERDDSGVAILYSQRDLFAAALARELVGEAGFTDDRGLLREHEAMLRGVTDAGAQFVYITEDDLVGGGLTPDRYHVLMLSLASSLSDEEVA